MSEWITVEDFLVQQDTLLGDEPTDGPSDEASDEPTRTSEISSCNVSAMPSVCDLSDPCNALQQVNQAILTNDEQAWDCLDSIWEPLIDMKEDGASREAGWADIRSLDHELREKVLESADSLSCYVVSEDVWDESPMLQLTYVAGLDGRDVGISRITLLQVSFEPDGFEPFNVDNLSENNPKKKPFLLKDGHWFLFDPAAGLRPGWYSSDGRISDSSDPGYLDLLKQLDEEGYKCNP